MPGTYRRQARRAPPAAAATTQSPPARRFRGLDKQAAPENCASPNHVAAPPHPETRIARLGAGRFFIRARFEGVQLFEDSLPPFLEPDLRDPALDRFVEEVLLEAAAARFVPELFFADDLVPDFEPPRADEDFFAPAERALDRVADFEPLFEADLEPPLEADLVDFEPALDVDFEALLFADEVLLLAEDLVPVLAPDEDPLEPLFREGEEVEEPPDEPLVLDWLVVFDLSSVGIAASFMAFAQQPSRLIKATSLYQVSSDNRTPHQVELAHLLWIVRRAHARALAS